jgi:hypothetical protein
VTPGGPTRLRREDAPAGRRAGQGPDRTGPAEKETEDKAKALSKSLRLARPKIDIYGTEEKFAAHPARMVRMTMTWARPRIP